MCMMNGEYNDRNCCSHSQTMDEISQLRQDNEKIREELKEVKKALDGFRDFEDRVIARYEKKHRSLWQRIIAFFKGE